MLETLVVVILGINVALALPQVMTAMKAYRLYSAAAQMNVTRFRATSQNTPYRLTLNAASTPTPAARIRQLLVAPCPKKSYITTA